MPPLVRPAAAAIAAALVLLPASPLQAQTSPAGSTLPAIEPPVVLSPFTVSTERDDGFVATSSLAGGRLATDLKDTPVAYSVITREFLDALNLTDTESAVAWSVGAYAPQTDNVNYKFFNNEAGSSVISRGIQTTEPQRNFFLLRLNSDTYSQERIDFSRGPNALLIGTGGLGGVVNGMTKQAKLDRTFTKVSAQAGSWNKSRATIDHNQRLGDRLAVRANLMYQDADSWRDEQFDERRGGHVALTFQPFKHTRIRAEYEHYKNDSLFSRESITDQVSGWDGVTTVAAPTAALTGSDAKGLVRLGSSSTLTPVYIPGSDPGTIQNWSNTWTTRGGGATSATPVGGVLPLSTANLGVNNGLITGSIFDPDDLFRLAEAGSAFRRPNRDTVIAAQGPNVVYKFDDVAVFLEHQQGEHLFFEAGGNYADTRKRTEYLQTRGIDAARIDVNATLPNGQPNPNFKQVYGEGRSGHTLFNNEIYEGRAALAVVFDNTRWGSFRANVMGGARKVDSDTAQFTEVFNRNADVRQRSLQDGFVYRYYFNDPVKPSAIPGRINLVDPIAGTSTEYEVETVRDILNNNNRFTTTKFTYLQGAATAKLFKDRLSLIGGVRRDTFKVDALTPNGSSAARAHDLSADWDGRSAVGLYRPSAPADFFNLTFVPKDAAGKPTGPETVALTRPRDSAGKPLPQFANDRFRDDFRSPKINFNVTTFTGGGVLHGTRWLSGYFNYAETFNAPTSGLTLTGDSVPPGTSEGRDYGIRFNFGDGRVSASFGRYRSTQANTSFDSSGNTRKYADIAAANAIGDLSPNGMNTRGLALIPTPTFDFQDRKARGYEIDIVANLTRNWRLTANAGFPTVQTTNIRKDEFAFLNANESTLKQIVQDAGVAIDADNVATVDLSVPVAQRSPDVTAAATAWNNIQNFKKTNDPKSVNDSDQPTTFNFFTDYRFARGPLKNLRLGSGVQYIGKKRIGNRGGDTIIDPANPLKAIDDPAVDSSTAVNRGDYYTVSATASYEYKLKDKRVLSFALNVTNLLQENELIYIGSGLRPPGGDVTRPDRTTVPTGFIFLQPRSFTFTASLTF